MSVSAQNISTKEIRITKGELQKSSSPCLHLLKQCITEIQIKIGIVLNVDSVVLKHAAGKTECRFGRQFGNPKANFVILKSTVVKGWAEVMIGIGYIMRTDTHVFELATAQNKGTAGLRL